MPNSSAWPGLEQDTALYLSSYHYGVYISHDKGDSWKEFNQGLPSTNVRTIAKTNTLYACMGGQGIYMFDTFARTWVGNNAGISTLYTWAYAETANKSYAGTQEGLYVQQKRSTPWVKQSAGTKNSQVYCFLLQGTKLFAGSNIGLFSTLNEGTTWVQEPGIPDSVVVNSLLMHKGVLYAGTSDGVFSLTSPFLQWKRPANSPTFEVNTLTAFDNYLFIGTQVKGLFSSSDGGATWVAFNQGLTTSSGAFSSLSHDDEYLYVGTYKDLGFARRSLKELGLLTSLPVENEVEQPSTRYLVKAYNLQGQEVDKQQKGCVILLYSDGSREKQWR